MNIEKNKETDMISNQLRKAFSSVEVNYRKACRGKYSSNFLYKLKIVNKKADECLFWLKFINDFKKNCKKDDLKLLILEANELVSMVTSFIKTIDSKIKIINLNIANNI